MYDSEIIKHNMFFDNLYEFYFFDDTDEIDDDNNQELNDVDYTSSFLEDKNELEELEDEKEFEFFEYEDSEYEKAEYEDEISFLDVSKISYSYNVMEFFVRITEHYHLILLI